MLGAMSTATAPATTPAAAPPAATPTAPAVPGPAAAAPSAAGRNPVGAHVPVAARGLAGTGLAYARRVGAEAVQVFVANPRGWATPRATRRRTPSSGPPAPSRPSRRTCTPRT